MQIGLSCKGTASGTTPIKLALFLTIPGPVTLLSPSTSPAYTTITGSVTDLNSGGEIEYTKTEGTAGNFIVAGSNEIPYWLWIAYGANIETQETLTGGLVTKTPRGCWFLAEEI